MRRLVPLLLALLLCGCGSRVAAPAASASLPVELEAGVWPETALTENAPQPEAGKVGQVLLLDGDLLLITVEDLDYGGLTDWLDRLTLSGFTTAAFTQEGKTTCGLLTDGSTALSFSHLGDTDTLTISLSPDEI